MNSSRTHKALVVGGSGGIGRAISIALAKKGVALRVHGRREAKVADTLRACRAHGVVAEGIDFDFESDAPWPLEDMLDDAIDTLVVAYGPLFEAPLRETPAAEWRRMTLDNLALPGALVSAALPAMRRRGYGRILLFGTARSDMIHGFTQVAAYAVAKTGLGVIARSVMSDDSQVTCNVICPGYVKTEYYSPKEVHRLESRYGPLPDMDGFVSRCMPYLSDENRQSGVMVPIYREYGPWHEV